MSSQVTGSFSVSISNFNITDAKGIGTIGTKIDLPQYIVQAFANGTNSAGKANQLVTLTGTLATTVSTDIDLYAYNSATDGAGNAITLAKLKLLIVKNTGVSGSPVEADYLTIGGKGTSAGWTSFFGTNADTGKIYTGGAFILFDPGAAAYAVGNSTTNHLLTLTAGSNSGTIGYEIVVVGTTS